MPGFWDNADTAKRVQKEIGRLQDIIKSWEDGWHELDEADLLLEMATEENDGDTEHEVAALLPDMERAIEVAELECMFSGEHDASNVMISIHAGAGGTEA
ncbi:MAG TPA: PCRF domain-containing protein, partial [Desulfocapsa sulfexigens]|nr:PCRF domain-containing protein [Desulfocapsa sulfexigens]